MGSTRSTIGSMARLIARCATGSRQFGTLRVRRPTPDAFGTCTGRYPPARYVPSRSAAWTARRRAMASWGPSRKTISYRRSPSGPGAFRPRANVSRSAEKRFELLAIRSTSRSRDSREADGSSRRMSPSPGQTCRTASIAALEPDELSASRSSVRGSRIVQRNVEFLCS